MYIRDKVVEQDESKKMKVVIQKSLMDYFYDQDELYPL